MHELQDPAQHSARLFAKLGVAGDLDRRVDAERDVHSASRRRVIDVARDEKLAAIVDVDRSGQQRSVERIDDRGDAKHVGLFARNCDVVKPCGSRARGDREGVPRTIALHIDGALGRECIIVGVSPRGIGAPR
jgi:hypothetical protein